MNVKPAAAGLRRFPLLLPVDEVAVAFVLVLAPKWLDCCAVVAVLANDTGVAADKAGVDTGVLDAIEIADDAEAAPVADAEPADADAGCETIGCEPYG